MAPKWMKNQAGDLPSHSEALRRHLEQPDISAEEYSRRKHLELGARVLKKTRIYLDQKYWIYCRDAHAGKPNKPEHKEILDQLKSLVSAGRAVCPVSYSTAEETSKQGNPSRRRTSVALIDLLCRGVVLRSPTERIRIEFMHLWASSQKESNQLPSLAHHVWTFPGWITGEVIPCSPKLAPLIQLATQKFIFDKVAEMSFSDAFNSIFGNKPTKYENIERMAFEFSAPCNLKKGKKKPFATMFADEVKSFLSCRTLDANEHIRRPNLANAEAMIQVNESIVANRVNSDFIEEIKNAFSDGRWTTQFPYLHITAGVHAMSGRGGQPYRANDLWDYDQACSALPYCDAFFTEKRVGTLLTQKPLNYDQAYGCRVLWQEGDIIDYLRTLSP